MDEQSTPIASMSKSQDARRKVYAPVFVAVAASLAAVVMFNPVGGPGEGLLSKAAAQQPRTGTDGDDSGGRVSAAEQRKDMISQLRAMNARMERMEALMSRGLTVRVSEMPQIRFPTDGK
jgi:hypothetical protein